MAKYIELPNLKENLTNFLNKKIDPIYAKKTEIPSTVVDDALSLTSTNPVQNKVVKAEFDKVNSNLSDYGLTNVVGNLVQGRWINGIYDTSYYMVCTEKTKCNGGEQLNVKLNESFRFIWANYFDGSGNFISESGDVTYASNAQFIIPSNAKYYVVNFQKGDASTGITPQTVGHIGIYINNVIDELKNDLSDLKDGTTPVAKAVADEDGNNIKSTYATKQDIETTTLTTTSGTATLYKLGKMRHLVLNNATFSSTNVIASTDASVGTLYIRAEILISGGGGDELEGAAASFEDICISGSNMWNATRTATGASPVAVKGATGSATWMAQ